MTDSISQQLRNHRCHSELTLSGEMAFSVIKEEGIEPCEDYSGRQVELNIVRLEKQLRWKRCDQTYMSFVITCFCTRHFLFFPSRSLKGQLKNLLFYFHKGLRKIRKYKEVHIINVQKDKQA